MLTLSHFKNGCDIIVYICQTGLKRVCHCQFLGKETRRFSNHESRLLSRSHTFEIIVILHLKIHQSMWIHWPFFPKTWTKGHWPLDDLWPHVCWGQMCDSTQGSLCPSPMTIHQCMWIQWVSSNLSWFASLNNKAFGNLFCNPEKSFHTSPRSSDSNNRGYRPFFKLNNGICIYKKS